MPKNSNSIPSFHDADQYLDFLTGSTGGKSVLQTKSRIAYHFGNHFHPFSGDFIAKLNKEGIEGFLDVKFQEKQNDPSFKEYDPALSGFDPTKPPVSSGSDQLIFIYDPYRDPTFAIVKPEPGLNLTENGAYSVYNWELYFHAPLLVAVHLSKNQRFAEAQKWFHYIFDPTSNDKEEPSPGKFWKFLQFRNETDVQLIEEMLKALAAGTDSALKTKMETAIEASRNNPFQPHVIARTRFVAYQMNVVMSYLDNLIAWGDSLFRQDTMETINEATQIYVLAANILGPRPQKIPPRGKIRPKTFAQLRNKLDAMGNAMVGLEGEFPFNLNMPGATNTASGETTALWGIGRSLYFCIPKNDKLLGYWDTVADRLYKIRNCLNIQGIFRKLALFDPPIDPGLLVKAAAAGIDLGSLVGGLNQPASPLRAALMIQKALEICAEVKALGANLLSAIEKKEGEDLSLLRQSHELKILALAQDVRFLQWKEAEANTEALLKTRETTFQRFRHYQLLMGKPDSETNTLQSLPLERKPLTEEGFDGVYQEIVGKYAPDAALLAYPDTIKPANEELWLSSNENTELNTLLPAAHEMQTAASIADVLGTYLSLVSQFIAHATPVGVGAAVEFGGQQLSTFASMYGKIFRMAADDLTYSANRAAKTAGYQRRMEDWTFQRNLAASEMVQIGRQVIASLIREQSAQHEFENHKVQIENAQAIDDFLKNKFAGQDLYGWMQGELSKIYYDCYKFAFDVARKAEVTMKTELMRPELDALDFIQFGYWDGGRKGLLAGEKLYLDIRRMEMAYHDQNRREYELTKHISLQQLDPLALLKLKATGVCEFAVPEWLYDMDGPGHYMRRIKSVSLSIPCIAGPYISVNCTLALQKSSLRKDPVLAVGEYARQENEDTRFRDYFGSIQSIVTSNAQNDSGMFETNLRDERYLPFEGAGAESTWRLEMPADIRQFDYNTIADVILHVRYTAREGGQSLRDGAVGHFKALFSPDKTGELFRLFSLQHDFPNEWHRFVKSQDTELKIVFKKEQFPYFTNGKDIIVSTLELHSIVADSLTSSTLERKDEELTALNEEINASLPNQSGIVLTEAEVGKNSEVVFLLVKYHVSV